MTKPRMDERTTQRDRLAALAPGGFAALPHAVLVRRDVSAAAKTVYAAFCDRLGSADGDGYLQYGTDRLADATGLHRATVLRAVSCLEDAGLIDVRRGHRQRNAYRLIPAETWSQCATGSNLRPVRQRTATGSIVLPFASQSATRTGSKARPHLNSNSSPTSSNNTPLPPKGGDGAIAARAEDGNGEPADGNGNTATRSPHSAPPHAEVLLDRVEAAWREATGGLGMDARLRAKFLRKIDGGGAEAVALVDADVFRAARKLADAKSGGMLGVEHVMQVVARRAMAQASAARASADTAWGMPTREASEGISPAALAEMVAAFERLPDEVREGWLERVEADFPMIRNDNKRREIAAQLAARKGGE